MSASDRSGLTAWESQKDGTLLAVQLQPGSPQSVSFPHTRGTCYRQPTAANAVTTSNLLQSSHSAQTVGQLKTTVQSAGAEYGGQSKASSPSGWSGGLKAAAALDASGLRSWTTNLKTAVTQAAGEREASSWNTWPAKLKQATDTYSDRVAKYYKPPLLKVSELAVAPDTVHNDAAAAQHARLWNAAATASSTDGDYAEAALQAVQQPSIQDSVSADVAGVLCQNAAPGWSVWSGRLQQAVQEGANGESWQQVQQWGANVTARVCEQVKPMMSEVTVKTKGLYCSLAASVNAATEQVGVRKEEDLQQLLASSAPL